MRLVQGVVKKKKKEGLVVVAVAVFVSFVSD